jgi:hypothetical protein
MPLLKCDPHKLFKFLNGATVVRLILVFGNARKMAEKADAATEEEEEADEG